MKMTHVALANSFIFVQVTQFSSGLAVVEDNNVFGAVRLTDN